MANPGTQVTYNGVTLNNVTTRQWREEVVYDPSGTDLIFKRFHLEFEGYCHQSKGSLAQYGPWIETKVGSGGGATATLLLARKALQMPRCLLTVNLNGTNLLTCYPCNLVQRADRDVNQGPHPLEVQITQISADKLFKVLFSIECCKVECANAAAGATVPNVISNRWSVTEELDDNFFTTRIIRGRLRLSQNVNVDPHMVKAITIPPLETGFARKRVSLLAEPNGLEAAYEVVDRQVAMAAPWPATSISGSHSYMTGDGMKFMAECRLRLTGAPNCDQGVLVGRAIQCLDSRLNLVNRSFGAGDNKWCFDQGGFSITLHFGAVTAVEIYARILDGMSTERQDNKYYFNQIPERLLKAWDLPPFRRTTGLGAKNYNPAVSWEPDIYGYTPGTDSKLARSAAAAFAKRCLVSDPCYSGANSLAHTGNETQEAADKAGTVAKYREEMGSIPSDYASDKRAIIVGDNAKSSIYTYCTMEAKYVTHRNNVQLPMAPGESSDADADTCFVATVASPTCYRVLTIDAERVGAWPEVPPASETIVDGKLKGTLLDSEIRPHPPVPAGDASRGIYRLFVKYVYAMNRPPKASEAVRLGASPVLKYDASDKEATFRMSTVSNKYLGP